MLNSIKTMKRYCKATLNMFFNKKNFDDHKKPYLYDIFFVSSLNFTTEHAKIVKSSRFFFQNFSKCSFSMFLVVEIKVFQGCSRFLGFLETLEKTYRFFLTFHNIF